MNTKVRKYITISIPLNYEKLIPNLRTAYQKDKGVSISRGETIGIAMEKECERLNIKA